MKTALGIFLLYLLVLTNVDGASRPLVDVRNHAPSITLDIRYATQNNFTGKRVAGYQAEKCLLHEPAAQALAAAEAELRGRGFGLIIYDCYRPQRAVTEFMTWAKAPDDPQIKARYYPDLAKSTLVPNYIAEKSGHSKGATVDIGLQDCRETHCNPVDMGTPFDFFGVQANTEWPGVSPDQKQARQQLLDVMASHGFANYPLEWWHFTWKAGPLPDVAYDFPVE